MAHHTLKSEYSRLTARLNRFPQGAPPSELLHRILAILFSEREAELVSSLPIKPFSAEQASRVWNKSLTETRKILDQLADRALLVDLVRDKESLYVLPPPMAGFFEFSLMRVRDDIDQKQLSELFYQYLNVEEDFIKDLFVRGETQLGRVFVNELSLPEESGLHVLDYERASEVIKTASHIGLGVCYCRHKMEHVGRDCDAPKEICMTFNSTAESLIRHGYIEQIDVARCLELLQDAYDHNLVQFGENVRERVAFICNCCGCCCEAMITAKKFGLNNPVHTTNFIPCLKEATCKGCGKCVSACPVEAMSLVTRNDPKKPKKKKARLNPDICLGCGVCQRVCAADSIQMQPRPKRVITPRDTTHRTVVMALERGRLADLIFDNRVLLSHRVLAAVLENILKLSPVKRAMASQQIKSRYLEALLDRFVDL